MDMYTQFEEQVLFFYDQCPTREQIRSLSKMYKVPQKDIVALLKQHGREIPEKLKAPVKEIVPAKEEIPESVKKTVIKRIDILREDIRDHQDKANYFQGLADNYKDMVDTLKNELADHVNYLERGPFEQGNLSHGSDNMIESPQPKG